MLKDSNHSIAAIIPLTPQQIGQGTIQTVNARDLHAFLENGDHFATWIKNRISQYEFIEGVDFTIFRKTPKTGGRALEDYFLSLDMAKELSMVERNEKGKQARRYFEKWLTPTELGGRFNLTPNAIGRLLKSLGLHGDFDAKHAHSQPVWDKSRYSNKEVVSYRYNPDIVLPKLAEALNEAKDKGDAA